MAEHFQGKFEVELKYRVKSKDDFLKILNSIKHDVMLHENVEFDCYFDTPEQQLLSENKSLCIREMQPSGIKLWIVKGPEADRCEAINIPDTNKAKSMLTTMGYIIISQVYKIRSIYFVGKFHITLDNLEGLGYFAEFAIMTDDNSLLEIYKSELMDLAAQFGLSSNDVEHKSYRTLYTENLTA